MKTLLTNDKKINQLLLIFFIAYLTLLIVITADTLQSLSETARFWPAWLLQAVPLLMMLPGVFTKRYRSFSWVCFLMLAYFSSYVVQVYSSNAQWIDWLGLVTTIIIFVSAMLASRLLQRYFLQGAK